MIATVTRLPAAPTDGSAGRARESFASPAHAGRRAALGLTGSDTLDGLVRVSCARRRASSPTRSDTLRGSPRASHGTRAGRPPSLTGSDTLYGSYRPAYAPSPDGPAPEAF